jgi:hypothetical protein
MTKECKYKEMEATTCKHIDGQPNLNPEVEEAISSGKSMPS